MSCKICRRQIKAWLRLIAPSLPVVELVAFTGSSGAAFGYWFADMIGARPVQILKESEESHGGRMRGTSGGSWIFLDDMIESGATYNRVRRAMISAPEAIVLWLPKWGGPAGSSEIARVPTISRDYYDNVTRYSGGLAPVAKRSCKRRARAIVEAPCHPQQSKSDRQLSLPFSPVSPTPFLPTPQFSGQPPLTFLVQSFSAGREILLLQPPPPLLLSDLKILT